MGVNKTLIDEIYEERVQYLVNTDEMMYEIYEPVLIGGLRFRKKLLSIPQILIWSIRFQLLTAFSQVRNIRPLFN